MPVQVRPELEGLPAEVADVLLVLRVPARVEVEAAPGGEGLWAEVAAVRGTAGVLVGVVPEAPAAGEGLGAVGAGEPRLLLLLLWLHIGGWGIGIGCHGWGANQDATTVGLGKLNRFHKS